MRVRAEARGHELVKLIRLFVGNVLDFALLLSIIAKI
jgi:hypothetical protein